MGHPPSTDDRASTGATVPAPWRPDLLGEGWQARTLRLTPDDHGEAVATLVRRTPSAEAPRRRAVLYVHGYVDYFFQRHLGDFWDAAGYDFYALDLRTHGRSLLPHQLANYCTELAVHAEELDLAVRILREEEGHDLVVANGHSTGGLLVSLWAHARRGSPSGPDALVLNSPWFDLNKPWFDRVVTTRVVDVVGRVLPRLVVGGVDRYYGEYLHETAGWEYDLAWKPDLGFGARAGWLRTIRRAHRAVARGLAIDVPVLVCASTETGPSDRWHDRLDRTDSVLAVEHIVQRAPLLGPDVTVVQIEGGIHDLALSPEPARSAYFDAIRSWLGDRLP
ncbi:alpha/beta hydrolase [Actinotalea sp. K2]|uniref:alpha/beta hydrolase n=1 Tax=Actinotalea sp. K2 TaxID=2939438 RepID=UPI002017D2BA|nr:alpha/beta hydrolase [Actinotalea sp. K2]MCL3863187.1 alpha/beta hydrolase [Actinotalea sp. K2]